MNPRALTVIAAALLAAFGSAAAARVATDAADAWAQCIPGCIPALVETRRETKRDRARLRLGGVGALVAQGGHVLHLLCRPFGVVHALPTRAALQAALARGVGLVG